MTNDLSNALKQAIVARDLAIDLRDKAFDVINKTQRPTPEDHAAYQIASDNEIEAWKIYRKAKEAVTNMGR